MVGVGIDGEESSLARVSIVNYHGAVLLDEVVKQRERVVDYRTEWSGIRPGDMVNGKSNPRVPMPPQLSLNRRQTCSQAVRGSAGSSGQFTKGQDFGGARCF